MGTEFIKLTFITRCDQASKADLYKQTTVQITMLIYHVGTDYDALKTSLDVLIGIFVTMRQQYLVENDFSDSVFF